MKKIIAIAVSVAALLSCSKESNVNSSYFEKGQTVTLSVNAGTPATKVTSDLNADGETVDFQWAEGDKIKVTVNSSSAEFTLKSGSGAASAVFEGVMPASGSTFSIQYPATDPILTTQTYSSPEALPHDMMTFTATGCTLGSSGYNLAPQSTALRLNLYGTNQTVSKIVVTNTTLSETYTLNISPAVTLSADSTNPTPFFVVVPAGSHNFSAEVINAETSPATPPTNAIQNGVFTVGTTNVFTTSSAKTFEAGQILNMDAKQVSITKVYFSKGNMYYDGTDFKFEDTQYSYHASASAPTGFFRWATNSGSLSTDITSALSTSTSTLSGSTGDVFFTNATQTAPRSDFTVANQTGVWRTLSLGNSGEWSYLLSTRTVNGGTGEGKSYQRATINSDGTGVYGLIIYPDNYTSQTSATSYTSSEWSAMESAGCVFLPAAGYWNGSICYVGSYGYYWSSTPSSSKTNFACLPYFGSDDFKSASIGNRSIGFSVRLVSAAQ